MCKNINHLFNTPKDFGMIYLIHSSISEEFSSFKYDTRQRSFKRKSSSFRNIPFSLNSKIYGYENISDILNKMKARIEEFKQLNSFYDTSAINKYVHGLRGFDVSRVILENSAGDLLCEEFFKNLCEEYPDDIIDLIADNNFDESIKIEKLNKLLNLRNDIAIITALKTIQFTIDIEAYIYKFRKVFALKARRKELSIEQIINKYR